MAGVISLINGSQRRVQFVQNNNAVITIDASITEKHSRESTPTEFEVENGQVVSDHLIMKPFALSIQGVISDTPLNAQALAQAALTTSVTAATRNVGVVGGAIAGAAAGVAATALFSALSQSKSPSIAAYGQLLQLQSAKQPFDVVTTLNTYKNMWIKSISIPRDSSSGRIILFDVELVQLLLVTPQTVDITKYASPDLSAKNADKGKQETSQVLKFFRQGVGDVTSVAQKAGLAG